MARHGWGIYLPNEGEMHVGEAMEVAGSGCYTLLHHTAGRDNALRRIRAEYPDALIQVRCYTQNWYALQPADWARQCWGIMHAGGDPLVRYTRHLTWANEQNLASESGGQIGASFGQLATWHDYEVIAAWNEAFIAAYRAIDNTWADVLHYPGLAYGHGEDWGYDGHHNPMPGFPVVDGVPTPAYELLRRGIDQCPILNHHPYVQAGAAVLDEWVGVRRIEKTIALFPGKSIYVAETGNFAITSPTAPADLVAIGYYLQGRPEVVGFTPFILDSPDPGHAMNNWMRNPAVAEAYRRTTRLDKLDSWVGWTPPTIPPEVPTVPDVDLSVPERNPPSEAFYNNEGEGNFSKSAFGPSVGVEIHSTASPNDHSIEAEYLGTLNWFQNPAAGVSAQRVIGAGQTSEVNTSVHDRYVAYHGRNPDNRRRHSIELAHPDTPAWNARPYLDFQYEAAGECIARWKIADAAAGQDWPIRLLTRAQLAADPLAKGVCYHRDTPAGVADGKRDPTGPFDGPRLIETAERWHAQLTGGGTPVPFDINKIRDQLWDIANVLEANGWPWLGQGIKALVALSKGDQ